jgi:glycosyltransferase involved in cell wall biosynthesis
MRRLASVSVAHPTGATHAKEMIKRLKTLGALGRFYTLLSLPEAVTANRWLPAPVRKELSRRRFALDRTVVRSFPSIELFFLGLERLRIFTGRLNLPLLYRKKLMNRYFDWRVSRVIADDRSAVLYGYIGSCEKTMKAARKAGIKCVLEVTSPLHSTDQEIFSRDALERPDWAWLLPDNANDFTIAPRQLAALRCADLIVVPSDFVRRSLPADLQERVRLVPYSLSGSRGSQPPRKDFTPGGAPLKVLFVGGITQRKGISLLADLTSALGDGIELTIVGKMSVEGAHDVCQLTGATAWFPSLPNEEVKNLMRLSDVLVLPSISDAFGLVVLEAMAMGTPVIVSSNVGASELVNHGKSGLIFRSGSSEDFASSVKTIAEDRSVLPEMSVQAMEAINRLAKVDLMMELATEVAAIALENSASSQ